MWHAIACERARRDEKSPNPCRKPILCAPPSVDVGPKGFRARPSAITGSQGPECRNTGPTWRYGPHHPRETCPTEPQPCESSCHFYFADAASSDFSSILHFTPHHRQSTEQAGQKATGVELDGQNMFGVPEDSACQEVQLSSRIREPRDIENRGKGTKMEMEANKTGRYRKRKPSMRASGVEPRESTGRGPEHRIDLLSQTQIRMVPQSGATVPVELWWCR